MPPAVTALVRGVDASGITVSGTDDVVVDPMLPVDGMLAVSRPEVDEAALTRLSAPEERAEHWRRRLASVEGDRSS